MEDVDKGENTIVLSPPDCAIVFRDNGSGEVSPEIFLPNYESGEDIVSVAATLCSIVAMRMGDDNFIKECYDWMDAKMIELNQRMMEAEGNDEG